MSEKNNEEKLIDIKGTLEQFVKPDEPEMSQEEAIMKYEEDVKKASTSDESENTEEQEHLKRIKKELLASLERVKKLEKQIFIEKEVEEKKKIKVEKASSSGKTFQKVKEENDVTSQKTMKQKERE